VASEGGQYRTGFNSLCQPSLALGIIVPDEYVSINASMLTEIKTDYIATVPIRFERCLGCFLEPIHKPLGSCSAKLFTKGTGKLG